MGTPNFRAMATIADLVANACGQPLKLGFPVRMMLDRHPGCLNHHPAQITTPLLGDAPSAIGLP